MTRKQTANTGEAKTGSTARRELVENALSIRIRCSSRQQR